MPVLRFHLLTITHEMWDGGFTVTITTNAACHLYLRYSDVFPRIHRKSVLRRGLVMGWDARYCFVAYHHIEQNEENDTFTHTFTWPGWQNCETRYFYFWGTMGGQDMVSDTPIFWLHYLVTPPAEPTEWKKLYPDAHPEVTSVDGTVQQVDCYCAFGTLLASPGNYHNDDIISLQTRFSCRTLWGTFFWDTCVRSILTFDCTPIPSGTIPLTADLYLHGITKSNTFPDVFAMNVYEAYPNSDVDLVNTDYQRIHSSPLSDNITYENWKDNDWNIFSLNPAGVALIIPGAITRLGLRDAYHDVAHVEPSHDPANLMTMPCYAAEKGDPFRPYLEVGF